MTSKRTLLIDGDTVAFIAASVSQHTVESPNGLVEPFAIRGEGQAAVDNLIYNLMQRLDGTEMKVFLSCPSEDNWRLKIDPEYKSNRKNSVRPYLLDPLKDYLRLKYDATHLAGLEADDTLGIYATSDELCPGEKIVVGRDKDFATIPGLHYQLKDNRPDGSPIIREYSPLDARLNHYVQALAGDAVDGFAGCPGVGMKTARRIVENPERLVAKQGVITRGKNKGKGVIKWHSAGPCSIWEAVVSNYEKAGLGEPEALKTARLAKILLADNYDINTKVVTLWVPGEE